MTDQILTVNTIADIIDFKDDFAGAGRLFHLHLRFAHHLTAFRAFAAQGFQGTDAPFITGTAGFDALTDPDFFLRQLAVKFRILHLFDTQCLFLGHQIIIITARPGG